EVMFYGDAMFVAYEVAKARVKAYWSTDWAEIEAFYATALAGDMVLIKGSRALELERLVMARVE
ncbi:hypothetical protein ABTM28_20825, partial [Acinetobacter baumannii]